MARTDADRRETNNHRHTHKKERTERKKKEASGTHMHRCPSLGRESRVVQVLGGYVCQEAIVALADTSRLSSYRGSERGSRVMQARAVKSNTPKALNSRGHRQSFLQFIFMTRRPPSQNTIAGAAPLAI